MDNQNVFNLYKNIDKALADTQLRKNLKSGMDSMSQKRRAVFSDEEQLEQLRDIGHAIRMRTLQKLPELLEKLEQKCIENGIHVHWAETTTEANQIVLEIIQKHGATKVVKQKSMVTEEMHLNHYLEQHQIEIMETDLGEFIIQLANEGPSHIIVPAIHKNKNQVSKLFHEKIPDTPYTEDVEELNAIARKTLRQKFFEGEIGISGVNFAIAENGTLCLVENEGNGRMCTTLPPVHIAVMGLEKVMEKMSDIPPILSLLAGSATGQIITTYFNMIKAPRQKDEKDGPQELHLVILDNGRSHILSDPELRKTLLCIRCGTCLNHCPVYTRLGGHAYGFIYPGPIGIILTPQIEGLKKAGDLLSISSLCNACEEVCPVRIPIPKLIRKLREASYSADENVVNVKQKGYKKSPIERMIWKGWQQAFTSTALNTFFVKMAGLFSGIVPKIGPLKYWTSVRSMPKLAKKSLHQIVKEMEDVENE
jgi:L-lactate dehydrogenase complex protein LldF